ncbi:MAG: NAD-dependent epimerase/dehydratase family protein [Lachnospiraceae bacterium]|nr:NAD-dependent epimerase/dehydratase family protein [Lachnospiraceae bacterium]MBR4085831.1 NAD-dependent epimerase/dehydratase family protein [Lachnospiraceae bacterium]
MKILVIGGTRFFGIHTVNALLKQGHDVTIATRWNTPDSYGDKVKRISVERTDAQSLKEQLGGNYYDVVIDKLAYCSKDIRNVLEVIDCGKYIHMSSTAVYNPKHMNTSEEDFDGGAGELVWCDRDAYPYDEVKRQAEYALWQQYQERNWVAVRYPFVIGQDDYTKRLAFYVEHVKKGIPMNIDNIDAQMSFIRSDEAGEFMAFLVDKDFAGAINGASAGTISIREILTYVEEKTGVKPILSERGETAPYNGEPSYSINTKKAEGLGYTFTELKGWIYELLDEYIENIKE